MTEARLMCAIVSVARFLCETALMACVVCALGWLFAGNGCGDVQPW